jgi:hypothetical protein
MRWYMDSALALFAGCVIVFLTSKPGWWLWFPVGFLGLSLLFFLALFEAIGVWLSKSGLPARIELDFTRDELRINGQLRATFSELDAIELVEYRGTWNTSFVLRALLRREGWSLTLEPSEVPIDTGGVEVRAELVLCQAWSEIL